MDFFFPLSSWHGLFILGAYIDGLFFFTVKIALPCKAVWLNVSGLFTEPQTTKKRGNLQLPKHRD